MPVQELEHARHVEAVTRRRERSEILGGETKEPQSGRKPATVDAMRRKFEVLLQMHERARGLDKSFEIGGIVRSRLQPEMFEDVVRFVIALLVPASEKTPVTGMLRNIGRVARGTGRLQPRHETRNPLAFACHGVSLLSSEMRGKPACRDFPTRGGGCDRRRVAG